MNDQMNHEKENEKTEFYEDLYMFYDTVNNIIQEGMLSLELTEKEIRIFSEELDNTFSMLETIQKLRKNQ